MRRMERLQQSQIKQGINCKYMPVVLGDQVKQI